MKTELVFFDTTEQSIEGTKRGLVAFVSLILLDLIWFNLTKKIIKYPNDKSINIYTLGISYVLLCSAISVQKPNSIQESIVYAALVGLVVYGIYNFTNYSILSKWTLKIAFIDTLWGIINCTLTAIFVYLLFNTQSQP